MFRTGQNAHTSLRYDINIMHTARVAITSIITNKPESEDCEAKRNKNQKQQNTAGRKMQKTHRT